MNQDYKESNQNSSNDPSPKSLFNKKRSRKKIRWSFKIDKKEGLSIERLQEEETTGGEESPQGDPDDEGDKKKPNGLVLYSAISGTALILIFLFLIVYIPCPTAYQAQMFRIILAVSLGAYTACFTGILKIKKNWVVATASFGVFLICYATNAAQIAAGRSCGTHIIVTIHLNKKSTKGIEAIFPKLQRRKETDEFGRIDLDYDGNISLPLNFSCNYKNVLDTSLVLTNLNPDSCEYWLQCPANGL